MKVFVGIILGFFSGFLIYMAAGILFISREELDASRAAIRPGLLVFVCVTFFGGWVLSTWILVRGARTISRVFSRGFLLGAAEWLAMIPVGMILSGKALTETVAQAKAEGTDAGVAALGATIGAGLASFVTGGVSVVMALMCLLAFAVSYFIGREMKPESATAMRTCPECAELIQTAARKCKHCGSEITQARLNPVLPPSVPSPKKSLEEQAENIRKSIRKRG